MFSTVETFLFPGSLCGVPLTKGEGTVTTVDETDEHTLESRECYESLSRSQQEESPDRTNSMETGIGNPKKVRFAIDDKDTTRKRKNRNLRKMILEKSRSIKEETKSGIQSSQISSSQGSSDRRKKVSSPKRLRGRRRKAGRIVSAFTKSYT